MSPLPVDVRDPVLEAARRLYEEHGEAFTMAQLEDGSGVSRATIYRRVGAKRDVLAQLAEQRGTALHEPGDVRSRILEATRVVFGARGLRAATIEHIAAEAGVGVATVYRHFGDKQQLAHAFMDEMTPRLLLRDVVLHATDDVTADLGRIVETMVATFTEHGDLMRWILLGGDAERRYIDQLRAPADSTFDRLTDWFATQIAAQRMHTEARAEDLALALIGMAVALTIIGPLRFPQARTDPRRAGAVILELLLGDLRERET